MARSSVGYIPAKVTAAQAPLNEALEHTQQVDCRFTGMPKQFPRRLQERIDALREDEHLREELQHKVDDFKAAQSSARAARSSMGLTPRQQLASRLLRGRLRTSR